MRSLDYIPTPHDLYNGLVGQHVVVYTMNTPLGGTLTGVSTFFVELKSESGVKYTYVLRDHIVAISSMEESTFEEIE